MDHLIIDIIIGVACTALGAGLAILATAMELDRPVKVFLRKIRIIVPTPIVPLSPCLQLGNLKITDWVILDGFSPEGVNIVTSVDDREVKLPKDLRALRRQIEHELEQGRSQGLPKTPHIGEKYALSEIAFHRSDDHFEMNTCRLRLKYSDYLNFLTTSGSLERQIPGSSETVREKYFRDVDPHNISHDFLFNSFGVNIAVITSDDRLVIVKRGKNVLLPEVFNSSVNEGLSRDLDVESNRSVSVYNAGYRGLHEELGVEGSAVSEYKLTSIGFSRSACQYGALGFARLKIPFDALRNRLALSKDASFEIDHFQTVSRTGSRHIEYSVYGVPNTPRAFAEFLETTEVKITSWGLVCYLLSFLANNYKLRDLEKCFREPHWKDDSFIV